MPRCICKINSNPRYVSIASDQSIWTFTKYRLFSFTKSWLTQQKPTKWKSWFISDGPWCLVYLYFFSCIIKRTQLAECLVQHKRGRNGRNKSCITQKELQLCQTFRKYCAVSTMHTEKHTKKKIVQLKQVYNTNDFKQLRECQYRGTSKKEIHSFKLLKS